MYCGSFLTEAQSTGMRCSLISQRGLLLTTLNRLRWSAKKILKLLLWVWCRVVLILWQSAQALEASSTLKYFTNTKFFITYTSSIYPYFPKKERIDCSPASYSPDTYNSRTKMHSWIFSGDCACSISSFCLASGNLENISCTARSQVIVLFRNATRIFWSRYSIRLYSSRRYRERERERECRCRLSSPPRLSSPRRYSPPRRGYSSRSEWLYRSRLRCSLESERERDRRRGRLSESLPPLLQQYFQRQYPIKNAILQQPTRTQATPYRQHHSHHQFLHSPQQQKQLQYINKTYMASIAKRKEQVNELRKAHFPFGFETNKGAVSEYRQEYNEQPLAVVQPNGDRSSHFTIASDEPAMANNTYQSEFKEKYPEHPHAKKEPVKRSNDENNIVLGFGAAQQGTNYKDEFVLKQQERSRPINQRVISVDLGDTLTDFTTSYNKAYEGTQGERAERTGNNNSGANLVLGYDNNHFLTSNAATHNAKPILPVSGNTRSYGTNISLGSDEGHYHSEQKAQFAHKSSAKQSVERDKVLDFKSAHFKFGFPEQTEQHLSEAQAHYKEKPLNAVRVQGRKPVNVQLRHDGNNYFQSSYGEQFTQKKGDRAEVSKNGRNSNVIIGMGSDHYQSEAQQQFTQKNVDRVKGKGAECSLTLGDGTREFSTQYQQVHGSKIGQIQQNRVSKEDIVKMRAQNFVKGFNDLDYKLHSQNYGATGGEGNRLPREVIDKMRSTNIVNSDNNAFQGSTTHKAAYGWKKNDDF